MLWIKAFHIIFMVTWFAGLFYLPRLFVYHAMANDLATQAQFKIMERKLYFGIMTPGGVLTILFGLWLWLGYGIGAGKVWLAAKFILVAVLIVYHLWCGHLVKRFRDDANSHGHVFYRWFNEFPVLILVGAVLLVVFKPA
ncbi:MAG: CopD family protein [Arenicellales bacterium]|jgi:putative membrane protein|nr:CopD family protein [Arenicellales bacterium]